MRIRKANQGADKVFDRLYFSREARNRRGEFTLPE